MILLLFINSWMCHWAQILYRSPSVLLNISKIQTTFLWKEISRRQHFYAMLSTSTTKRHKYEAFKLQVICPNMHLQIWQWTNHPVLQQCNFICSLISEERQKMQPALYLISTGFALHPTHSVKAVAQLLKYSVKAPEGNLTSYISVFARSLLHF